jgi:hypothetical protein
MLAGTLCYVHGLGMSAIVPVRSGHSKRKRDIFAGGTGIYYLTILHVKLVTWSAGGHLGVRFLLRASRVIQQCAVTSHSQNTVWRSSALNTITQSEHQKMFQRARSSYGACEAVRSVWNLGHAGFTRRTNPNSRIQKKKYSQLLVIVPKTDVEWCSHPGPSFLKKRMCTRTADTPWGEDI